MTEPKMQLEDWLDDLCVRFIINLPEEDLSSVARICFQVEEAQWYYEDFIRPLDPTLPSMSLRNFCLRIFQHCPLLSAFSFENHMKAFEEFLLYKTRVPVRGAIMLNDAMDSVVLVKGWKKGANWSFPRGKINKDEDDLDCAIREVYEETGYDIEAAGLVPADRNVKYIELAIREQHMRLYVFRDVPMDTPFEPKTRKEISKIQWYRLSDLPAYKKKGHNGADVVANANKFYMVAPFLGPLKKWVTQQLQKDTVRAASNQHLAVFTAPEETMTEDEPTDSGFSHLPRAGGVAAVETLEGATAALQRLLKIQPATQGLQTEVSPTKQSTNSGEALLALLNGSNQAPVPQTVPYQLSHLPPTFAHVPGDPVDHAAIQPYGLLPNMSPTMGAPLQRFPGPRRMEPYQPRLQHPQPLPPQVQSSVFAATVNDLATLPAQHQMHGSMGLSPMQQFIQSGVPISPHIQPALNSHSLSLLSAFKGASGNAERTPQTPRAELPAGHENVVSPASAAEISNRSKHQQTLLGLFKQPESAQEPKLQPPATLELPAMPIQPTHNSERHPANTSPPQGVDNLAFRPLTILARPQTQGEPKALQQSPKSPRGSRRSNSRQQSSPRGRVPSDEKQKTFQPQILKRPQPSSPLAPLGPPAEGVATTSSQALLDLFRGQPNLPPTSAPVTQREASTSVPNQLLDLFKQGPPDRQPQETSPQAPSYRKDSGSSQTLLGLLKQPELEQRSPLSPQSIAIQQPPLPGNQSVNLLNLLKPQAAERPAGLTQEKQNLLSMFGTAKMAPETKPSPPARPDLLANMLTRSRVGSLAMGAEALSDSASRRGSQTPISPADQAFLLGYLEKAAQADGR